ncbi:methyl-accepting chemotaxis protein [Aquabacterium sp.]|uniref:methyl-accepting chemotaxis protein n=1 Tax=Aquabacterium sp. TaxID=1872578 RepID=UPI0035B06236
MQFLGNLKIGQRLALGFGVILCLFLGSQIFGKHQAGVLNDNTVAFSDNIVPSLTEIYKFRAHMGDSRRYELRALLQANHDDRIKDYAIVQQHEADMRAAVERYKSLTADDTDRQLLEAVDKATQAYAAISTEASELAKKSNTDPVLFEQYRDVVIKRGGPAFQTASEAVEALWKHNEVLAGQLSDSSKSSYTQVSVAMIVAGAITVALTVLIGVVITRSIVRPLNEAVQVAETVASGDLTSVIHDQGRDETAQVLTALRHMNDSLVNMVTRVRQSSESISTGATEIAMGNADLSQRTEEQASNLEETAAAMEELNSTVRNNADTAHQAARIAAEASSAAAVGGDVVNRVVQTMGDITHSSRRIADIISVIDGIAFQTNILALNAAVEAARAGEQGRGFAVVAGEVRALAQRSANAAREIKTLINESVEKVAAGESLVSEAGQHMQGIVQQVQRVTGLINEIASASNEQSTGIDQVSDAVMQLDQVTQQNAALVEESAAASESLKHQAQTLNELVSVFRTH